MTNKCYYTEKDVKAAALELSKANPKIYYTVYSCFGLFIKAEKHLNVFAPSDSKYNCYWHNGMQKTFTEAQISNEMFSLMMNKVLNKKEA